MSSNNSLSATPLGIDFGTTTSLMSMLAADGEVRMVPNTAGDLVTPSALFFGEQVIVGREALQHAYNETGHFVSAYKRDMGEPHYHRQLGNYKAPPEVLAAFTLRKLKSDAEAKLGRIGKAILTVPAYYDEQRRQATLSAARLAGLDVAELVNEPTAAALAYLYENREDGETPRSFKLPSQRIMVYDLGGGTFDVSILESSDRSFRTLATDGDVRLGGRDFDQKMADEFAEHILALQGIDPRADWRASRALRDLCEQLKHELSSHQKASSTFTLAGVHHELSITRFEFEQLAEPLIDRTLTTCGEVLAAAELEWKDIDQLLLVGGSSRIPFVAECLAAKTGITPQRVKSPEEAVARGAAIYAATQTGDEAKPLRVVNVNAHSLGIPGVDVATNQRINRIVIPRNTPLPASASRRYVTRTDDQRSVKVNLLEGESINPKHCTSVANCIVRLEPGLPAHTEVVISCLYNANGTITASAMVPATRSRAKVDVKRKRSADMEDLSVWAQRLTTQSEALPQAAAVVISEQQLAQRRDEQLQALLQGLDAMHARMGQQCVSLEVPPAATAARQALLDAQRDLQATEQLRGLVREKIARAADDQTLSRMQSDAALLGMYASQSEQLIGQLQINLGRECAKVDFFPQEAGVVPDELQQRTAELLELL